MYSPYTEIGGVVFLQIPARDIRLPKRGRLLGVGVKVVERQWTGGPETLEPFTKLPETHHWGHIYAEHARRVKEHRVEVCLGMRDLCK